jgi:hypothetical protein
LRDLVLAVEAYTEGKLSDLAFTLLVRDLVTAAKRDGR